MKNNSIKTKVITGALTIGMILSTAAVGFAASDNTAGTATNGNVNTSANANISAPLNRQKFDAEKVAQMKAELEAVLKDAVSTSVITQDESDKILAREAAKAQEIASGTGTSTGAGTRGGKGQGKMQGKGKEMNGMGKQGGLFADLVTEGILTQEKADALHAKMDAAKEATMQKTLEDSLKTLVTSATLTQEQADKISAAIKSEEATKKAEFDKINAMTETERQTYMQNNKPVRTNPIATLVTDGTLTQAQADEIAKVLPMGHHGDGMGQGKGMRGSKDMTQGAGGGKGQRGNREGLKNQAGTSSGATDTTKSTSAE